MNFDNTEFTCQRCGEDFTANWNMTPGVTVTCSHCGVEWNTDYEEDDDSITGPWLTEIVGVELSDREVNYLRCCPDALRLLKSYHDIQATMGEPMGIDCSFHNRRMEELEAEAVRREKEMEDGQ